MAFKSGRQRKAVMAKLSNGRNKRRQMWDWLDKVEGRKDSSYNNWAKEVKRQGYKISKAGEIR